MGPDQSRQQRVMWKLSFFPTCPSLLSALHHFSAGLKGEGSANMRVALVIKEASKSRAATSSPLDSHLFCFPPWIRTQHSWLLEAGSRVGMAHRGPSSVVDPIDGHSPSSSITTSLLPYEATPLGLSKTEAMTTQPPGRIGGKFNMG